MKPIAYIEKSVISYLASRPNRDVVVAGLQAISQDWWQNERWRFELRISALVEEEIGRGDASAVASRLAFIAGIPSFAISDMAIDLVESLIAQGESQRVVKKTFFILQLPQPKALTTSLPGTSSISIMQRPRE